MGQQLRADSWPPANAHLHTYLSRKSSVNLQRAARATQCNAPPVLRRADSEVVGVAVQPGVYGWRTSPRCERSGPGGLRGCPCLEAACGAGPGKFGESGVI